MTVRDLTARLLGDDDTVLPGTDTGTRWNETMMGDPGEDAGRPRRDELHRLEDRFERLALLTAALAELVLERLGATEEDLAAKIAEIDGRDGAVDGRRTRVARPCTSCQAAVPVDRTTCQFCGHPSRSGPLAAL